jgi:glucosamine--fructose-6-phosphate aminotransferase (isomerizing)
VAATKSFTAQLTSLYLLALYLAEVREQLNSEQIQNYIEDLTKIPQKIESTFGKVEYLEELSKNFFRSSNFLFLGRGIHYPVALEGALKLKEISYIHAEGYPSGEMKHGPNALIDETLPVVVVATSNINNPRSVQLYEKTLSNIKEVKARDGVVISLVTPFNKEAIEASDYYIEVPPTNDLLLPILEIVPLQLLSYYIAVRRGCDVDQPRNLAKSVTVE